VVPPGGGKTLIGLEAARRLGRPTVVLCPNTAIQAQWIEQWHAAFAPATVQATASRELPTALTVLTYQAVCTIGHEGGHDGGRPGAAASGAEALELLHPHGRALIERLAAGGPWTVILDECHHLLELWGRPLTVVLAQLDRGAAAHRRPAAAAGGRSRPRAAPPSADLRGLGGPDRRLLPAVPAGQCRSAR
jgi:superfamily II DNA or RNA helicase